MNEKLYEKVQTEYENFISELRQKPPDEIIRSAYEKVFKEEFLNIISNRELSENQAEVLLNLEYPLQEIYQEWLSTDGNYNDMLRDCIADFAADLGENQEKPSILSEISEQKNSSEPHKSFNDVISEIMPEVDVGGLRKIVIYRENNDWNQQFTSEMSEKSARTIDPFYVAVCGIDLARGGHSYVFDKILSKRLWNEFEAIKILPQKDEFRAVANFIEDNLCEFSVECANRIAEMRNPLYEVTKLMPFEIAGRDLSYDEINCAIDTIERKAFEKSQIGVKIPQNKIPENAFEYGGYHFIPYRKFEKGEIEKPLEGDTRPWKNDAKYAMRNMSADDNLRILHFSHDDFYAVSKGSKCDIFQCVETGNLYVPTQYKLFLYDEPQEFKQSISVSIKSNSEKIAAQPKNSVNKNISSQEEVL
jgi:hypothetical protein